MTKLNAAKQYDAVIYLWQSDAQLIDNRAPVWIGIVKKYIAPEKKLTLNFLNTPHITNSDMLSTLMDDVAPLSTVVITAPAEKRQLLPRSWLWDGRILQIRD